MRKSRGRSIDPWGTPIFIILDEELTLFIDTYCFLEERYYLEIGFTISILYIILACQCKEKLLYNFIHRFQNTFTGA